MGAAVRIALIIGAAMVMVVAIWVYFSPHQTCVRDYAAQGETGGPIYCAQFVGGFRRG